MLSLPWYVCCILLLLLAALAPLLAKAGIRQADTNVAAAWRSTMLLVFLLLLLPFTGDSLKQEFTGLSGMKDWLLLLLGVAMAGGAWLFYNAALKTGSVVRTVSLLFLLPLPLLLLSLWLFPSTRFSPFTVVGQLRLLFILLFLVAGVLLCFRQNGKWIRNGLLSMFLFTGVLLCFRFTSLAHRQSILGRIALCVLLFAVLSWISVLLGHRHSALDIRLRDFLLLLFSALAAAGAVYFCSLALQKYSKADIVYLFLGLSLLLLFPLAYLFLKEKPAKEEVAALLIMTAGILFRSLTALL